MYGASLVDPRRRDPMTPAKYDGTRQYASAKRMQVALVQEWAERQPDRFVAAMHQKISHEIDIEELIKLNEGCDILIFEGFKKIKKLSKIEVNLKKNNKELLYKSFDNVKLLVSDDMSEHPIKVLSHDQVNEITKEILSDSF